MKPRKDEDIKLSMENLKSLKELMGDAAYYRWLSDKFPHLSNNNLRHEQALQFVLQLKHEIIFMIVLYQRIQIIKNNMYEAFEMAEQSRNENYKKEQEQLLLQIEEITKQEQKKITDLLKMEDDQKNLEKMNQLLVMINRRIVDLSLEIDQYKALINRVDNSLNKIDKQISKKVEALCVKAGTILDNLPLEGTKGVEDKKVLLTLMDQMRTNKISASEFMEKFSKISYKYVAEKPELMNFMATLNVGYQEIKELNTSKKSLVKHRDDLTSKVNNLIALRASLENAKSIISETNNINKTGNNSKKVDIQITAENIGKLQGT